MNPEHPLKINTYKKLLKDLEHINELDNLHDLEERLIKEIVALIEDGSPMAQYLLEKLEKAIYLKLNYSGRNKILLGAFRESLSGAFSAARDTLI
ncbi:MAG: hypothetical protein ABIH22_02135 [Candidatus Margulisiibacteriota bacterium]